MIGRFARLPNLFALALVLAGPGTAGGELGIGPRTRPENTVSTVWSIEDGLPSHGLNRVFQASDGYLWIASFNGLIRFDGVSFTVFDRSRIAALSAGPGAIELVTNGFNTLAEDPNGVLWIGTQGNGILQYENGRFRLLEATRRLRHTVRTILVDQIGHAWIGVTDGGAYELRDGELVHLGHPALSDVTVRDIVLDRNGTLWFATEGKGLVGFQKAALLAAALGAAALDGATAVAHTAAAGLASDAVTNLHASASELWIATREGLNKLEDGVIESFPRFDGVEVSRVHGDGHGNLWLATARGLFRRSRGPGLFERFAVPGIDNAEGVDAITFDREGSLWLLDRQQGLIRLKESRFETFSVRSGLPSESVSAVAEAGGRILVGSERGIVSVVEAGEVSALELHGLPDTRIHDILADRRQRLWVTTYSGLLRVDERGERFFTTEDGLPTNLVRHIYEDRAGVLWIGTRNGGLLKWTSGDSFEVLDTTSGLRSSFVFSVGEDRRGNLLVGTRGGLHVIGRDGRIRFYSAADGMPGTVVFNTFTDGAGDVWICTNGGLARLRGDTLTSLSTGAGLPTDGVFDYEEDDFGFAWMSSSRGAVRVEKKQLMEYMDDERPAVEVKVFDERDGMISRQCTASATILKSTDGRLWFPTVQGVAAVDPGRLMMNGLVPPVVIDGLTADGRALSPPHGGTVLEPGIRRLRLSFSALSFRAPSRVEIRYKLEGFDEDWQIATSERAALYTNLAPGPYRFRVVAANDDGLWNEEGASLDLFLRPFFYQTLVFRTAMVCLAAAAVFGGVRWRVRAIYRRNRVLEQVISAQRHAEMALRNSEARFRSLFSEASDAILIVDGGKVTDCNIRACETFGHETNDLAGKSVEALCADEGEDGGRSLAAAVRRLGPSSEADFLECRLLRAGEVPFDAEVTLAAFALGGRPIVQAIVRDVSERISAENERKNLISELERRQEEMERFVYTVSHDLKNPLVTIQGFLGLLERDAANGQHEPMGEKIERIKNATGLMARLLHDILELSSIGRLRTPREDVLLSELAGEAADHLAGPAESDGVRFVIAPDMPVVRGERLRLLEMLLNLLENAVKFMGDQPSPRVEVGVRDEGEVPVFYVRDNGIGIDPRYQEKVFGLFERLDPECEGTGVGLAIVKRTVETHGGRVWVESGGRGHGSSFCFTLNRSKDLEAPMAPPTF